MAESVDDLYGLPLQEFTPSRNELAKRLGDPEIKKLKKPSVSAWAVNQLARKREVDVRRLLRAGERLEQAQRGLVGGGDQRAFAEAQREERDAVRRLRTEAAEILRDGGHPASDATLERLAATLHAGAATEDGRALLRDGRLTEDLEPLGFGAMVGVKPPPGGARERPKAAPEPRRPNRQLEKAKTELKAAQAEADAATKEAKQAEREADRARRAAERANERVERLQSRVEELTRRR
jgi:Alanine-zipper, major outer membrane lipoprotein